MSQWRVIDVSDFSAQLEVRPGRLLAADRSLPLDDVACVVTGPSTLWGAEVVAELSRFDIPIVTCDWRGVPIACTLPWSTASRVGARHRAQAELSLPRQKNAWKQIVRAKILGQSSNLELAQPDSAAKLRLLAMKVRSGDPDNLEARAARTYWTRLLPDEGFARARDGGGRNDLLNYGYAVVRGIVIRSIVISGLSPTLGIWHSNRANTFALADDLIEPFRPAVDFVVAAMTTDASLESRVSKAELVSVLALPMAGVGESVATTILDLAQAYAIYVEGHTARLSVPVWHPPDG